MSKLTPAPAPVRPRATSPITEETLLLEDLVRDDVARFEAGAIWISGPPGAGKHTALEHLASVLPRGSMVTLIENPTVPDLRDIVENVLVVYSSIEKLPLPHVATYALKGWGQDECLEYLMRMHPQKCACTDNTARVQERKDE